MAPGRDAALCGGDVALLKAGLRAPTILGHHVVVRVLSLEDGLRSQWGVAVGDRVALEEYLPCQRPDCPGCGSRDGYRSVPRSTPGVRVAGSACSRLLRGPACTLATRNCCNFDPTRSSTQYPRGSTQVSPPGPKRSRTRSMVRKHRRAGEGSGVVVIGPGKHGIAAVAAARLAGAGRVVCVGLAHDEERLEIARALGGQPLVSAPDETVSRVRAEAKGHRLDVIVDTVGLGQPVMAARCPIAAASGKVVVSGPTRGPSNARGGPVGAGARRAHDHCGPRANPGRDGAKPPSPRRWLVGNRAGP